MADGSAGSMRMQISSLVQELLKKRKLAASVTPDQDLHDVGLTSLDMVNLMLAVEDEFNIEIPQRQLTPDNFRSIAAIERLVSAFAIAA
ncbi:MAG: phosphopantetheine-binding protein [Caulobacterales bacterium]